jgi:Tfp pilus assembly protein PilZ
VTVRPRAQLLLPLKNRAAFLDQSFDKGESGGLFVPGQLDVQLGEEVDVELQFVEDQVRFRIRGVVKWKRESGGRRSLPPGVGIEFLASEHNTRAHLLAFAKGKETVNHVERQRRYALQVDVKVRHGSSDLVGTTEDVSEGGCFVLANPLPPVGAQAELRLRAPGTLFGWITLAATVTWTRSDQHKSGFGVAFQFDSDRKRLRVQKIVALMKARMLRDVKVHAPRLGSQPPGRRAEPNDG